MLVQKCAIRRETLPILPCDVCDCEWYVKTTMYNNCFWVLATYLDVQSGFKFSFDEIAQLEGLTVEEVQQIYERGIDKLRQAPDRIVKLANDSNVS